MNRNNYFKLKNRTEKYEHIENNKKKSYVFTFNCCFNSKIESNL